jgi:hypothetical protein
VFLLVSPPAQAMGCQDLPLMQLRLQDGTVVRIFALDEQINDTTAWDMKESSTPPLPLPKALRIAQSWASKHYKGFDQVRIGRISLNERRCGFSRGRWFYVFDFDPVKDGTVQLGTGHFVAVLMDGTVIAPSDAPPAK